jgi:hypothetical protein
MPNVIRQKYFLNCGFTGGFLKKTSHKDQSVTHAQTNNPAYPMINLIFMVGSSVKHPCHMSSILYTQFQSKNAAGISSSRVRDF